MARKAPTKDDFKCTILKTYKSEKTGPNNKTDLMVIKWATGHFPVVENRRMYYYKKLEEWRVHKQAGIGLAELDIIIKNQDEIRELLSKEVVEEGKDDGNSEQSREDK